VSELITANDVLSIASVTFLTSRPSCVKQCTNKE